MSEMVEQVARAIAEAGNGGVWTDEQWYKEYQRDVHRIRARAAIEAMPRPWQNIDAILDALEKAGCCRNAHVHAAEDVVANTIRDWLNGIFAAALK